MAVVAEEASGLKELLFMAKMGDSATEKNTWLIGGWCSNHLTGNESLFPDLDRSFKVRVKIGNGVFLKIFGIGAVTVNTTLGMKFITNVHYVIEANKNLRNVGQLEDKHYAYEEDVSDVWHRRLGHVNYGSLMKMAFVDLVEGLFAIVKLDKLCETCQYGKLYDINAKKLFINRYVTFDEEQKWNWKKKTINCSRNMIFANDGQFQLDDNDSVDLEYDSLVAKGTRTLEDIYNRCNVVVTNPSSFTKANIDANWRATIDAKMNMIKKNGTWILVDRPHEQNIVGVKWIYRTKLNLDSSVNKHKAKLVVKGYAQTYGIDYFETFASFARHDTIKLLATLFARKG
ncbi:Uncharacterized protein TCM_010856 [Theobroma cacao]|uniref:Mitochondrial protein n=1 Tax=Theobroma cacao TaxID=3641 RepID=A0A061E7F2_THECC|nr:Uncharacterized protein TCM_010856 [Theobroma cacao]